VGSYLIKDYFENPLTDYDCQGYFAGSCGTPKAKWRHKLRVTWDTTFDTSFSFSWRFTGGVDHVDFSDDEDIASAGNRDKWIANNADQIGGTSFFDFAFTHDLTENLKITGGVQNLFDKEPPILPSISSTGYGNTYDTRGRRLFIGLNADF